MKIYICVLVGVLFAGCDSGNSSANNPCQQILKDIAESGDVVNAGECTPQLETTLDVVSKAKGHLFPEGNDCFHKLQKSKASGGVDVIGTIRDCFKSSQDDELSKEVVKVVEKYKNWNGQCFSSSPSKSTTNSLNADSSDCQICLVEISRYITSISAQTGADSDPPLQMNAECGADNLNQLRAAFFTSWAWSQVIPHLLTQETKKDFRINEGYALIRLRKLLAAVSKK